MLGGEHICFVSVVDTQPPSKRLYGSSSLSRGANRVRHRPFCNREDDYGDGPNRIGLGGHYVAVEAARNTTY